MVAMISIDPFLAFSDLAFHLKNTGIGLFWLHYVPDSKETKPASSDQGAFPSAVKNAEVVLVSCHACKCVPTNTSSGVDISRVPGCHLLQQMSCQ